MDAFSVRVPVGRLVRDFLFVAIIVDKDNSVCTRDGVNGPGYAGEEIPTLSTVMVVVASLSLAERRPSEGAADDFARDTKATGR